MMAKVMKYGEPLILFLGTLGTMEVWYTIYTVMWSDHKIIVVATALLFIAMIIEWWLDYSERKVVMKLLDNF